MRSFGLLRFSPAWPTPPMRLAAIPFVSAHRSPICLARRPLLVFQRRGDEFLDDLTEGLLIHTKSILPHETMTSSATCQLGSKHQCPIGYVCPETTLFVDEDHQKNVFRDASGHFCNCWVQEHVDQVLIPLLERNLYRLRASQ